MTLCEVWKQLDIVCILYFVCSLWSTIIVLVAQLHLHSRAPIGVKKDFKDLEILMTSFNIE